MISFNALVEFENRHFSLVFIFIIQTWTSSNDSFLRSILSSEAIFKEAPDWPL